MFMISVVKHILYAYYMLYAVISASLQERELHNYMFHANYIFSYDRLSLNVCYEFPNTHIY